MFSLLSMFANSKPVNHRIKVACMKGLFYVLRKIFALFISSQIGRVDLLLT